MTNQISKLNSEKTKLNNSRNIFIKGARTHNLKNIDVEIPRNKLVVITGVSGSGKSSLTIDTLYAEGQRRYVESLSSYARQFLMRMNKPDVDYIKGISPAIAIEQKVSTRTSRSTVGTLTEIYDYLRILFARIGKTTSPISGEVVIKNDVSDVVNYANTLEDKITLLVLIPLKKIHNRSFKEELNIILQKGFSRVFIDGEIKKVEDFLSEIDSDRTETFYKKIKVVIDRISWNKSDSDTQTRLADSVQIAFFESEGDCIIHSKESGEKSFSNRFEMDEMCFEEPTPQFFNFNNPYGACKMCEGFGAVIGIDEDLVIPDKNLSVYEGAVACWKGEKMKEWNEELIRYSRKNDFPIHRPYKDLSELHKKLLWQGSETIHGISEFFKWVESQSYKIQYRVMLSRYRGKTTCPDCKGTRLRKDSLYVKLNGISIIDLVLMPINEVYEFFKSLKLSSKEQEISRRILIEISNRLQLMMDVGLSYLTLNRLSSTLSGGETQRIHLTRMLGSNLTSSLYLLDEPSVGLHPRDTERLVKVLHKLRDLGNTVIVVEHEEAIMRHSDHIIDMGPLAGLFGGEITFNGSFRDILTDEKSLTAKYLTGDLFIPVPRQRSKWLSFLQIIGASEHNLKNVNATFPLNAITVVTGVSGSGKTTLVRKILYPALQKLMNGYGEKAGLHKEIRGDYKMISQIEMVDQNPLGKSSRSNPVTYIKAYDAIRDFFAAQHASKMKGFKSKHFSFNVEGGRCETCKGEGEIIVEMQFLADVHLVCEDCGGKRFKQEVLDIAYKEKNIADVLELSVDEAIEFFWDENKIVDLIKPLQDVGLGYVKLGQSSSTLSGGEAQRVKLASFLGKGNSNNPVLFIFDEPTTGLHFHDIGKLLGAFEMLIKNNHTVIIIEHNMEVIKCADHVIDLGPEGGNGGGYVLYEGTPEGLAKVTESFTGQFLKNKLAPQDSEVKV
ncbi:MAG: excinuclease ABC subunit UvrA [Chitinophagales bacterium]|nr:excinuclease ABC subunit UvrA [Chitinophagales bacterium]